MTLECRLDGPGPSGGLRAVPGAAELQRPRARHLPIHRAGDRRRRQRCRDRARVHDRAGAAAAPTPTPTPTATPTPQPEFQETRRGAAGERQGPGPAPGQQRVRRARRADEHPVRARRSTPRAGASGSRPRPEQGKPAQRAEFYDGIFRITQTRQHRRPHAREELAPCPSARRARRRREAEDAQAVGRRARASSAPRALQRRDRPRHDVARRRTRARARSRGSPRASWRCATSVRKKTVLVRRASATWPRARR